MSIPNFTHTFENLSAFNWCSNSLNNTWQKKFPVLFYPMLYNMKYFNNTCRQCNKKIMLFLLRIPEFKINQCKIYYIILSYQSTCGKFYLNHSSFFIDVISRLGLNIVWLVLKMLCFFFELRHIISGAGEGGDLTLLKVHTIVFFEARTYTTHRWNATQKMKFVYINNCM